MVTFTVPLWRTTIASTRFKKNNNNKNHYNHGTNLEKNRDTISHDPPHYNCKAAFLILILLKGALCWLLKNFSHGFMI